MKPLPLILIALLACSAGAAGGWVSARMSNGSSCTPSMTLPEPKLSDGAQAKPVLREAELAAKVESLERTLDLMHQELADLRSSSSRSSAVELADPAKAEEQPSVNALAALNKHAIKAVIEEDRAELARKAEEERKQKALEQSQQQAERVAKKVGLDANQTKQLVGFNEQRRTRMEELRTQMQDGGGDPQAMRTSFQELRTWSETQLNTLFGEELAGKIAEEDRGFGRAAWGGGGPGGGGPGGGANNNNNGGGGGRRNRGGGNGGGGAAGNGGGGGQPGNPPGGG